MSDAETKPETPNRLILFTAVQETKSSKRVTTYTLERVPEDETPSAAVRLIVDTEWTRFDGTPANQDKPETYLLDARQLTHFIQNSGKRS